jgi:hypothetical protein
MGRWLVAGLVGEGRGRLAEFKGGDREVTFVVVYSGEGLDTGGVGGAWPDE